MHKTGKLNLLGKEDNSILLIFLFGTVIKVRLRFDLRNKIWKIDTTHYTPTPQFEKKKIGVLIFFQSAETKRIGSCT